jgi:hypothetical protein
LHWSKTIGLHEGDSLKQGQRAVNLVGVFKVSVGEREMFGLLEVWNFVSQEVDAVGA